MARIYWVYLVGALVLAIVAFRFLKQTPAAKPFEGNMVINFFRYCFPRAIYNHPSAVVDYKYFVVNKIVHAFLFAPLFLGAPAVSEWTAEMFGAVIDADNKASETVIIFYTLCSLVVFDFSIFFTHYLQHKLPMLWQFHKVHHSAQVLTPITVYRMHPIDELLTGAMTTLSVGITGGLFMIGTSTTVQPIQLFQVNAILFLYYLAGYNLRHTHIWLNYPKWLLMILISPAQHQIHHSNSEKHFNKNFGFIFSFWDRISGSIYIPAEREALKFGLSEKEDKEFKGIFSLYFLPFKKAAALLRRVR
jgi:sterol desaturase/sphingolipid hydroxylase (fatty acid hydroxylase superfamily)